MNSLAKKLLIKPGKVWLLYNAPENYLQLLDPLPEGVKLLFNVGDRIDGVQLFVKNSAELATGMDALNAILQPDTIFWVMYPKKNSGIPTDLEMTGNWKLMDQYGLNGIAAAAIDSIWTALRFRQVEQIKKSGIANAELAKSDYSEYIDVVNKKIILPAAIAEALQQQPAALNLYESLSYSNKKEYVLWILTAKQEKTRLERLNNLIDKLLNAKKNPSEK